jgi:hypothetical protein
MKFSIRDVIVSRREYVVIFFTCIFVVCALYGAFYRRLKKRSFKKVGLANAYISMIYIQNVSLKTACEEATCEIEMWMVGKY